MENITISEEIPVPPTPTQTTDESTQSTSQQNQYSQSLTSVEITDENVALNVLVSFLNLAQKRGAFGIDESAKIWQCIQKFIQRQ